eukprot:scaffold1681_cov113-Skeletonema_dohrnii-CCMP3373.AAC.5
MQQLLQYQLPNNPLKLLDDYLSSIPSANGQSTAEADVDNPDSDQQDADATISPSSSQLPSTINHSAQAEQLHNSVLRVAAELFGNNMSLLENSLALLEEQEQYQNNKNNDDDDNNNNASSSAIIPPIRTIRAHRSGRVAVLVRKQRKKSRASNQQQHQSDKQIIDDYYLCLLGRDRVTIDNNNSFKTSKGTYLCTPHHRIGMHCTCRSFFHNIKGSGSGGSGGGRFKSNGERSPSGKASSSYSSSSGGNNNVVCKHLLAVILMPHLLPWRSQSVEEDVVDDKLFTKLVMRASIG